MSDRHATKRATMIATLGEKTGHDLEQWLEILSRSPAESFMDRVNWLKSVHGLGHFQARLVVEEARPSSAKSEG